MAKNHSVSEECKYNFTDSSNYMEVTAAKVLLKCSVDLHKFRYVSLLFDGDATTYNRLQNLAVYDLDISIDKKDHLNYICKRLKTGLKNILME